MDRQLALPLVIPSVKVVLPPVMVRIFTGARLLDKQMKGSSWRGNIDRESLNLGNPECCILGQLFEHYLAGCCELGIKHRQAVESGFHVWDPQSPKVTGEFQALTRAWRKVLFGR